MRLDERSELASLSLHIQHLKHFPIPAILKQLGNRDLPNGNHITVHPLQLLLRRLHGVGRGIQLVGLKGLV